MSRKTDLGMIVTTPINFKSIQALDAFEAELKKQWSVLNHNKQVHDGNKVSFELLGVLPDINRSFDSDDFLKDLILKYADRETDQLIKTKWYMVEPSDYFSGGFSEYKLNKQGLVERHVNISESLENPEFTQIDSKETIFQDEF